MWLRQALSQNTKSPSFHLCVYCQAGFENMKRKRSSSSGCASSSGMPSMAMVKRGEMYSACSPVSGCVRSIGWATGFVTFSRDL